MTTLVLANQKGGVGKSAIACQLAHYLNRNGHRVLVIDLDHQGNTSSSLKKSSQVKCTSFTASDVLNGEWQDPKGSDDASIRLVPSHEDLSGLERQPNKHNAYANALISFLAAAAQSFDVSIIDTNPNPDIRYAAALIASDYVLAPIQLNQEAIDGVAGLRNHYRYGYLNIKAKLNPKLTLIGLLPNLVEATPFQRANFMAIAAQHAQLLIPLPNTTNKYAFIPTRTAIAEAQAEGVFVADLRKTSAREAWRDIKPSFDAIASSMQLETCHAG
jgi:chromosome partitioning protein